MLTECNYKIHVYPGAYKKMLEHLAFLARVSIRASERLYEEFKEALDTIKFNPEYYSRYIRSAPTVERLFYTLCGKGRYRIVFEIVGDIVYIVDIQDCRQDTDKSLV